MDDAHGHALHFVKLTNLISSAEDESEQHQIKVLVLGKEVADMLRDAEVRKTELAELARLKAKYESKETV